MQKTAFLIVLITANLTASEKRALPQFKSSPSVGLVQLAEVSLEIKNILGFYTDVTKLIEKSSQSKKLHFSIGALDRVITKPFHNTKEELVFITAAHANLQKLKNYIPQLNEIRLTELSTLSSFSETLNQAYLTDLDFIQRVHTVNDKVVLLDSFSPESLKIYSLLPEFANKKKKLKELDNKLFSQELECLDGVFSDLTSLLTNDVERCLAFLQRYHTINSFTTNNIYLDKLMVNARQVYHMNQLIARSISITKAALAINKMYPNETTGYYQTMLNDFHESFKVAKSVMDSYAKHPSQS